MNPAARTHSVWAETQLPAFPRLESDLEVDVVVVGAGLTGITAACLLRRAGQRVALIDRDSVASGDTARTTAHLTYVTDQRLDALVSKFGRDAARAFWEAGSAAIDQIWALVENTQADCDFRWVPGYLHAPIELTDETAAESFQRDANLAQALGFEAQFIEAAPYAHRPAVRFAHQAKFHPRRYLAALLRAIPGEGSHVFENSPLEGIDEKPLAVRANGKRIRCQRWILATHNPLSGETGMLPATVFQTKLALYTSYVLGARLPGGTLPEALFWDTKDPYSYLRIDDHGEYQYAIFGGKDVKTGQEQDVEAVFGELEAELGRNIPLASVEQRWLGQVIETADGLPYIGPSSDTQFLATGFAGNGMTLGTVAAMMARDWCVGASNPWAELFDIHRKPFHGGTWHYVRENLDYPYYLLRDRLKGAEEGTPESLAPGEGRIVKWQKQKVAAYRDEHGALMICSPVCTHLKCLVGWNAAARTWDCPCHGSRFRPDGSVLGGPAEKPLERLDQSSSEHRTPAGHR